MKKIFLFLPLLVTLAKSYGQSGGVPSGGVPYVPINANRIPVGALQSLNMVYDARSAGMGDAGVALSPDVNSAYMNAAKLPFLYNVADSSKNSGISIAYTPWERKLIGDMALYGLNFYKARQKDAFALTVKYFNMGEVELRDASGNSMGTNQSKEFSLTGSYAKRLSDHSSLSIGLKYSYSNPMGALQTLGYNTKAANAIAGDITYFYTSLNSVDKEQNRWTNFGASLQNIGGKVNYGDYKKRSFQPTLLKVGVAENWSFGEKQNTVFTLTADAAKLLVPTPAIRNADNSIYKGKNEDTISSLGALFQSWTSAPNGFKETMQEVMFSFGAEAKFKNLLSLRGGYHTENKHKSDLHYFTLGLGVKLSKLGLDFSYLIPTQGSASPLANTWRLGLHYSPK